MAEQKVAQEDFDFTSAHPAVFLDLFEARAFKDKAGKEKGEAKFGAQLLLPTDRTQGDLKALRETVARVATTEWPGINLGTLHMPWENGTDMADRYAAAGKPREFYRGYTVLKTKSQFKPLLAFVDGTQIVDYTPVVEVKYPPKSVFYPGVRAIVGVKLVAYDGTGGKGITAYLTAFLSTRKGDPIGSTQPSLKDRFAGVVGVQTEEDPTAGGSPSEW